MIALSPILKQCIVLNRECQERCGSQYSMSPPQYRREFKSIFLNVGRRTGKTATVVDFYKPGDLVVVHSADRKSWFPRHMQVVSHQQFFDDISHRYASVNGPDNYIFFDEPFNMTATNFETLYHTTDAALYIFLGELRL